MRRTPSDWMFHSKSILEFLRYIYDITGGFMNTAQTGPPSGSGGGGPVPGILTQSSATFYFINPGGSEMATYKWVLNNGNASSTADFNIQGPTGIFFSLRLFSKLARRVR